MELINTVLAVLVKFIEHIITVMGPFGISLLMAIYRFRVKPYFLLRAIL